MALVPAAALTLRVAMMDGARAALFCVQRSKGASSPVRGFRSAAMVITSRPFTGQIGHELSW